MNNQWRVKSLLAKSVAPCYSQETTKLHVYRDRSNIYIRGGLFPVFLSDLFCRVSLAGRVLWRDLGRGELVEHYTAMTFFASEHILCIGPYSVHMYACWCIAFPQWCSRCIMLIEPWTSIVTVSTAPAWDLILILNVLQNKTLPTKRTWGGGGGGVFC